MNKDITNEKIFSKISSGLRQNSVDRNSHIVLIGRHRLINDSINLRNFYLNMCRLPFLPA